MFHVNFQDILYAYDVLDSTNGEAKKMIYDGKIAEVAVICASTQTAGRGRLDRKWISPAGNAYFTIAIKSDVINEDLRSILPFLSCIAAKNGILKAMQSGLSGKIEFKWPNDLILNDAKFGGILIEKCKDFMIIGIGINVLSNPDGGDVIYKATHLREYAGDAALKGNVVLELIEAIFVEFVMLVNSNRVWILNEWMKNAYRIGANLTAGGRTGKFRGIDDFGAMLLEVDGLTVKVGVGDVS